MPKEETWLEEGRVPEDGTDALAWYRSFHWAGGTPWGIYILDRGVHLLARLLIEGTRRRTATFNTADAVRVSFRTLLFHEYFHFVTDVAATTLEMAALARGAKHTLYRDYVRDIYLSPSERYEPLEEALANAFAFERCQPRPFTSTLRKFMRAQPSGYSSFEEWIDELGAGLTELGAAVASGKRGSWPPLETIFDVNFQHMTLAYCPVRIVQTIPDARYKIGFALSIRTDNLIESAKCRADLKKLPTDVRAKYEKAKLLLSDTTHPSLRFKPLKACDSLFSFRVGLDHRAAVRLIGRKWEVVRVLPRGRVYRELCR